MFLSRTPKSFRLAPAQAGWLVLVVVAVPVVGCGSDSGGGSSDGGTAGNTDAATVFHRDAAGITSEAGGEASVSLLYDGTVGLPCKSDLDCQPSGGPGLAVCSSSLTNPVFPTPVCVIPSGCNAGTDNNVHYCDGPDDPSSPGVCLSVGQGLCLPQCEFANDGSPAQGCQGNDACTFYGAGITANNQVIGIGYCWGACTADSQCPTGSSCQLDQGVCLTTVSTPTKSVGQACTAADNNAGGACSCLTNPNDTSASAPGLCTKSCQVDVTKNACPSGFVCQAFEPTSFPAMGTTPATPGFATQNTGLAGVCVAACSGGDAGGGSSPGVEADASSGEGGTLPSSDGSTGGGGGTCPPPMMCDTTTAAGASCLP